MTFHVMSVFVVCHKLPYVFISILPSAVTVHVRHVWVHVSTRVIETYFYDSFHLFVLFHLCVSGVKIASSELLKVIRSGNVFERSQSHSSRHKRSMQGNAPPTFSATYLIKDGLQLRAI